MAIWQASTIALWFVVAVSILLQVIVLRQAKRLAPENSGIPPGLNIPDTDVFMNGEVHRLHELIRDGAPTMFCFVHSSCRFCREMIPELGRVAKQYPSFHVVLLSFDEESQLSSLLEDTGVTLPFYRITTSYAFKMLNLKRFPFGMLVDREGTVMRREKVEIDNLLTWLIDVPQYVASASREIEVT